MAAFAFFGMAMGLFLAGIGAQFALHASSVPGAGPSGVAESRAALAAGSAQRFGSGCIAAASSSPGLVATSLSVSAGLAGGGIVALPANATCMTTPASSGGRNVFAFSPFQPGMVHHLLTDSNGSAAWFRVVASGQAQRITDGSTYAVPSSIPVGSVLNWVQLST